MRAPILVLLAAALLPARGFAQDPFSELMTKPVEKGKPVVVSTGPVSPEEQAALLKIAGASQPTVDSGEGGPTVVCDGAGGYRADLKGKGGLLHGGCLKAHEQSHVEDLQKTCPSGCQGRAAGSPHPWDDTGGRCPAFAAEAGFWAWRVASECRAYTLERRCLRELFEKVSEADKGKVRARVKSVRRSLSYWNAEGLKLKPALPCPEPSFD